MDIRSLNFEPNPSIIVTNQSDDRQNMIIGSPKKDVGCKAAFFVHNNDVRNVPLYHNQHYDVVV